MLARNTVRIFGATAQRVGKSSLVRPTCQAFSCFMFDVKIAESVYASLRYHVEPTDSPDEQYGCQFDSLWLYCACNSNDGSQVWYGFATWAQRQFFLQLMEADGVGAGSAYKVLDSNTWMAISECVNTNDQDGFRKLKGIGPKTADKLIPIIFKDRDKKTAAKTPKANEDAVSAVIALGYKRADAIVAVVKAQTILGDAATTEQLIKTALKR